MIFNYQNSLVSQNEILEEGEKLKEYIEFLQKVKEENNYNYPEGCITLPFNFTELEANKKLANKFANTKYIILVGIGGANLGTQAVYEALANYFDKIQIPEIIFLDTTNPLVLNKTKNRIDNGEITAENTVVNVISESGGTPETIYNANVILNCFPHDSIINLVVTTKKNSALDKIFSTENKLNTSTTQSGRFSFFSGVGKFPLFLAKLNVEMILEGARETIENNLGTNILSNNAAISAILLYKNYKNGKVINDNFYFNQELETLGKWYRQLMAESLGKNGSGIFPSVSIGSVDLHSMVQLYIGGAKNIFTTFVKPTYKTSGIITDNNLTINTVQHLENKSPESVLNAIYEGTKKAYIKNNLPFTEIELNDISERSLGEYMQFKMLEIMYLGKLLNVNTFNQPNVEEYKEETRNILSKLRN